MEGVLAGVILFERGGPGAGLEGILQAQVPPHGNEGRQQLGRGQWPHGVGHAQAIALLQQHRGQVIGHQLPKPFEGVGHHALGLFAQSQQGAGFLHQAGPGEGSIQIRCEHGGLRPDSRHFETQVKARPKARAKSGLEMFDH